MGVGSKPKITYMALVIFISALAHLLLLMIAPYLLPDETPNREQSLKPWREQQKKASDKKPSFQVVNLVPIMKTPPPDEARFRAEFDQKVEVEKKAATTSGQKTNKPPQAPKKPRFLAQGQGKHKRLDDPLGIRPTFSESATDASDDYLPDVSDGDKTELNAWQWKHAPFFNRMKEQIRNLWSPQTQIDRYDPEGQLLGQTNRVTVLSVTIDQRGEIKQIIVKEESGVAYLDEEAVRAFKEAAPFIYPPKELFDAQGEFTFTFAFHLELNRGFSLNFDWDK